MAKTNLPILEQRRIEANIIKPIYEEMVERLGDNLFKHNFLFHLKKGDEIPLVWLLTF